METRKLVKWGSSKTLIMSLPRTWTKKFNLTEENEVQVLENPDGSLLILPLQLGMKQKPIEAEIKSEQYPESQALTFIIKTKFLDGNDIIRISSKTPFPESRYQEIQNIVSQLIGFEILSKTTDEIILKDIMALKETSIEELVKMVSNTVLELMVKFLDSLMPPELSTLEAIFNSGDNVHKYYLRVHRQLRKALQEPALLTKMNLTAQDAVDYAFFIVELNDIASNLASMSYAVKKNHTEKSIEKTLEILQPTYEILKLAISSFLFKNTKEALTILVKIDEMKKEKRVLETVLDKMTARQSTIAAQIILDNTEKIIESTFSIGLAALRRAL
ncbi:MAG: AbrB/MazE/SpoVT family DNA-binding domain-containing protein [Candidatus Helarchaeota archaeon]